MKEKTKKHKFISLSLVTLALALIIAIAFGYNRLKEIYLKQCVIKNMETQVIINSGRMVKSDIIAENFGLKKGVNLALIDFKKKREELLARIPNLRNIIVARHLPDKVVITIEEREPVARLEPRRGRATGRVADIEGMVFLWQRDTRQLPVIYEKTQPGFLPGKRLTGRALAALRLLATAKSLAYSEVNLLNADIAHLDYISSTLGSNYSTLHIAWEDMDEEEFTSKSRESLMRQLTHLRDAIRSNLAEDSKIWNATEFSTGRIYADTQRKLYQ